MREGAGEIAASGDAFRRTFEQAAIGLAHIALDGRYLAVNERLCEIVGCDAATVLAHRWQDFTHPDDLAEDTRLRASLVAGERASFTREKRYRHAGGHVAWARISVSLARDEGGRPAYFIVAVEDETERRAVEERAAEARAEAERERERLDRVLASIDDGFITLDADWRFTYVNARAASFLRQPAERLLGRVLWDAFPESVGGAAERELRRARDLRAPHSFEIEGINVWVAARAFPADGGLAVYFQDVTERKRAERWRAALQQAHAQLATGGTLTAVLDALARAIEAQLPGALCTILLVEAPEGTLHSVAAPSVPPAFTRLIEGMKIGPNVGSCGTAAYRREVVVVEDVQADPLWTEWRAAAAASGLRACWSSPIMDPAGVVLGTFALYRAHPHAPDERERALVAEATYVAGIAIARARDEASLRQRERELDAIASNVPDVITRYDRDLRCTFANAALTREFGTDPSFLLGRSVAEIYGDTEDGRAFAGLLRRVLDTGEPAELARAYDTRNRGTRWVHARAIAERAGDQVTGVLVVSRDVTEEREALHALRESERRFRLLVENIGEVFYVTNPTFTETVYVSPAFERIWGRPLAALRADPGIWRGAIVAEDRARVEEAVREASSGGSGAFELEYRIRRPDGSERYIRDRAFGVRGPGGDVVRSVGIAEDLTERRRMEEALRASEAGYRALISAMDDAVIVFDRDGRYVSVAPTAPAVQLGAVESFVGRTVEELFPGETANEVVALIRRVVDARRTETLEYTIPVAGEERTYLAHVTAMDDHALWVARDITERRAAARALDAALERYRLAGRATQDVMWDWDPARGVVQWNENAQLVLGYELEETEHMTWWSSKLHPDDHDRVLRGYQDAIAGLAQYWSAEYRFRRGDGSWATLFDRCYFVRDEAGQVLRAIGAISDLTERQRLEEQLRQALKMEAVGRLAGGVAHDFNNLLTAIMSSSELALADLPPAHPVRADVEEVRRAAERAAGLTRQLLAFSRKQVLQPTVLDPNAVVVDMEKMLRRVIGAEIALRTELAPAPGQVRADRGQLEQVLMNLAVNARDAMPSGGALTIATGATTIDPGTTAPRGMLPGAYVTIAVRDTGHGMDEPTQARVFEPFFTTKDVGQGTGLGLATVYGIVKQSGGYVYLDSAPGRGATFTIYLPRVDAAPPALARAADDAAPHPALPVGAETVLVVEDEPAVRMLARRALTRYGYQVLEAPNGREALRVFETHEGRIDLVVTDLSMPEVGGRELAQRLRARRPDLRLLFMSGFADAGPYGHAESIDGAQLIEKPFAMDAFVRRVRDALDG